MAFFARVSTVLTWLAGDRGLEGLPTRAELEREADAELQAQIAKGRPSAEEAIRTRPRPDWATPRPDPAESPAESLEVLAVRVDLFPDAVSPEDAARRIRTRSERARQR